MRKYILLVLLLSPAILSHAQDSLSIPKKVEPYAEEQGLKNNIKYITFPKLMYTKTNIPAIQKEYQKMALHNGE